MSMRRMRINKLALNTGNTNVILIGRLEILEVWDILATKILWHDTYYDGTGDINVHGGGAWECSNQPCLSSFIHAIHIHKYHHREQFCLHVQWARMTVNNLKCWLACASIGCSGRIEPSADVHVTLLHIWSRMCGSVGYAPTCPCHAHFCTLSQTSDQGYSTPYFFLHYSNWLITYVILRSMKGCAEFFHNLKENWVIALYIDLKLMQFSNVLLIRSIR